MKCRVGWNLGRGVGEIEIGVGDLRQSGVSFVREGKGGVEEGEDEGEDVMDDDGEVEEQRGEGGLRDREAIFTGSTYYSRPYVDEKAYMLILEISGEESAELHFVHGRVCTGRVKFWRQTLARMGSLVNLVVGKMELAGDVEVFGVGEGDDIAAVIGEEADVVVDGGRWIGGREDEKKKRRESGGGWVLKRSQWRLKTRSCDGGGKKGKAGVQVFLEAVKIEAISCERARNEDRGFL